MSVSIENLKVTVEPLEGLEHAVTVSIPTEQVDEAVMARLKDLARKVKIDGFRPGKVPFHVVESRYSEGVRHEVASELVQSTLFEVLQDKKLNPAGMPAVDYKTLEKNKDFEYSAKFEIFPTIDPVELNKDEIEKIVSTVTDEALNNMLVKIQEQHKEWAPVSRAVANGDKVRIDFEGFLGNEAFEGGKAQDFELEIGSKSMIPGFEDGIVGATKDNPFEIKVTFPADYGNETLSGKEATFKITVHEILEGKLPELNDEFAKLLNIEAGGVNALKKDVQENMARELDRKVKQMNHEAIFEKFRSHNPIAIPNALVEKEIEHLKHEMFHRLFGHEHKENEVIPDFPRALFEEDAKNRVHMGLLFSEYVRKHNIVPDSARVDATLEKLATAYEKPEELRNWYRGNKKRMAEIEAIVLEEMAAEKMAEGAILKEKQMTYEEVMNPKRATENQGG